MRPHRGITLLVLGCLSVVVCGLFGPVVWIMARRDLDEMQAGTLDPAGRGLTRVGQGLGMLGCLVAILQFAYALYVLGFFDAPSP